MDIVQSPYKYNFESEGLLRYAGIRLLESVPKHARIDDADRDQHSRRVDTRTWTRAATYSNWPINQPIPVS